MFSVENILGYIKSKFKLRDFLIIIGIIALFFLTRTVNLKNFPIFSDEGIYIRWAKTAKQDASWRFISLTDGRQPLQTWVTMATLKLVPDDALIAGRLFAVISGFTALAGLFTLLFYLFGKKTAYIGSFLYIFTPAFLFYDRISLIDSAVNASCLWILFFSIVLVRTLRLDVAIMMGLLSGTALLSKSSAQLFMGLSVLAPVLMFQKKLKKNIPVILNYFVLLIIAFMLAFIIYNIQRLSPFFHYINEKNHTFILTFDEWLKSPFKLFIPNIKDIPFYAFWEMGWILPMFSFLGFFKLYQKDRRLVLYLLAWIIAPYIAISFFNKIIFPRYLLFFAGLFTIPASYYLSTIKNKFLQIGLGVLFLAVASYFNYSILFNAASLPFPQVDRGQYVESVSAVWGADTLMDDIRKESGGKPVLVLAEGDFGLVADVLKVFSKPDDGVEIKGLWPLSEKEIKDYQENAKKQKTYIVFSHTEIFPSNWPIKMVKKYSKPAGDKNLYLFTYSND